MPGKTEGVAPRPLGLVGSKTAAWKSEKAAIDARESRIRAGNPLVTQVHIEPRSQTAIGQTARARVAEMECAVGQPQSNVQRPLSQRVARQTDAEMSARNREIDRLQAETGALQSNIAKLQRKLSDMREASETLVERDISRKARTRELAEKLDHVQTKIAGLKHAAEIGGIENSRGVLYTKRNIRRPMEKLSEREARVRLSQSQLEAELKRESAVDVKNWRALEEGIPHVEAEIAAAKAELAPKEIELNGIRDAVRDELVATRQSIAEIEAKEAKLLAKLPELEMEFARLQQEIAGLQDDLIKSVDAIEKGEPPAIAVEQIHLRIDAARMRQQQIRKEQVLLSREKDAFARERSGHEADFDRIQKQLNRIQNALVPQPSATN